MCNSSSVKRSSDVKYENSIKKKFNGCIVNTNDTMLINIKKDNNTSNSLNKFNIDNRHINYSIGRENQKLLQCNSRDLIDSDRQQQRCHGSKLLETHSMDQSGVNSINPFNYNINSDKLLFDFNELNCTESVQQTETVFHEKINRVETICIESEINHSGSEINFNHGNIIIDASSSNLVESKNRNVYCSISDLPNNNYARSQHLQMSGSVGQSSELLSDPKDSVRMMPNVTDSIPMNQHENNSVLASDDIVQGELPIDDPWKMHSDMVGKYGSILPKSLKIDTFGNDTNKKLLEYQCDLNKNNIEMCENAACTDYNSNNNSNNDNFETDTDLVKIETKNRLNGLQRSLSSEMDDCGIENVYLMKEKEKLKITIKNGLNDNANDSLSNKHDENNKKLLENNDSKQSNEHTNNIMNMICNKLMGRYCLTIDLIFNEDRGVSDSSGVELIQILHKYSDLMNIVLKMEYFDFFHRVLPLVSTAGTRITTVSFKIDTGQSLNDVDILESCLTNITQHIVNTHRFSNVGKDVSISDKNTELKHITFLHAMSEFSKGLDTTVIAEQEKEFMNENGHNSNWLCKIQNKRCINDDTTNTVMILCNIARNCGHIIFLINDINGIIDFSLLEYESLIDNSFYCVDCLLYVNNIHHNEVQQIPMAETQFAQSHRKIEYNSIAMRKIEVVGVPAQIVHFGDCLIQVLIETISSESHCKIDRLSRNNNTTIYLDEENNGKNISSTIKDMLCINSQVCQICNVLSFTFGSNITLIIKTFATTILCGFDLLMGNEYNINIINNVSVHLSAIIYFSNIKLESFVIFLAHAKSNMQSVTVAIVLCLLFYFAATMVCSFWFKFSIIGCKFIDHLKETGNKSNSIYVWILQKFNIRVLSLINYGYISIDGHIVVVFANFGSIVTHINNTIKNPSYNSNSLIISVDTTTAISNAMIMDVLVSILDFTRTMSLFCIVEFGLFVMNIVSLKINNEAVMTSIVDSLLQYKCEFVMVVLITLMEVLCVSFIMLIVLLEIYAYILDNQYSSILFNQLSIATTVSYDNSLLYQANIKIVTLQNMLSRSCAVLSNVVKILNIPLLCSILFYLLIYVFGKNDKSKFDNMCHYMMTVSSFGGNKFSPLHANINSRWDGDYFHFTDGATSGHISHNEDLDIDMIEEKAKTKRQYCNCEKIFMSIFNTLIKIIEVSTRTNQMSRQWHFQSGESICITQQLINCVDIFNVCLIFPVIDTVNFTYTVLNCLDFYEFDHFSVYLLFATILLNDISVTQTAQFVIVLYMNIADIGKQILLFLFGFDGMIGNYCLNFNVVFTQSNTDSRYVHLYYMQLILFIDNLIMRYCANIINAHVLLTIGFSTVGDAENNNVCILGKFAHLDVNEEIFQEQFHLLMGWILFISSCCMLDVTIMYSSTKIELFLIAVLLEIYQFKNIVDHDILFISLAFYEIAILSFDIIIFIFQFMVSSKMVSMLIVCLLKFVTNIEDIYIILQTLQCNYNIILSIAIVLINLTVLMLLPNLRCYAKYAVLSSECYFSRYNYRLFIREILLSTIQLSLRTEIGQSHKGYGLYSLTTAITIFSICSIYILFVVMVVMVAVCVTSTSLIILCGVSNWCICGFKFNQNMLVLARFVQQLQLLLEGWINTGDCNMFFKESMADYALFSIIFSILLVIIMCIALVSQLYIMDLCILFNFTPKRKNMYYLSKYHNIESTTMLIASIDAKVEDIKIGVEILGVWCCHNVLGESMAIVSQLQNAIHTLNLYFIKCIAVGVVHGAVQAIIVLCLAYVRQGMNNLHKKFEKNDYPERRAVITTDQLLSNMLFNNVINYLGDYKMVFVKSIIW